MKFFWINLQEKIFLLILFSLPFIIPVWTISRTSLSHTNWQKIEFFNDEGIKFSSRKNYEKSIEYFSNALKLAPENKTIKKNLAGSYLQLAIDLKSRGEQDKAVTVLEHAVDLNASVEQVHVLLAKLYYEKGSLIDAEKETRIALLLKPKDPYLLKFLGHLNYLMEDYDDAIEIFQTFSEQCDLPFKELELDKIKEETKVFSEYKQLSCHPFVIHYPDESFRERAQWIAKALSKVYLRLGSWWGFYPESEIPVYLYPEKKFYKITKSRMDVVGLYDGKIRLLVNHSSRIRLEQTAIHEYTHHAFSCVTHGNTPFWCNEGLAQFVAGQWDDLRAKMFDSAVDKGQILDFAQMEKADSNYYDRYDRCLAYIQSYIAIDFLVEKYGYGIINELIEGLKENKTAVQVIEDITLLSSGEFQYEVQDYYVKKRKQDYSEFAALKKSLSD
ncbi:hypothetical protein J7L67_09555 [bacterium]|nr:hypothetical protein [bacterium]